jgi:zinc transporter 9
MLSAQPIGLLSVIAALAGNVFITIIKSIGFAVTGSSSLFSEVIHGIADTANQALLMLGIKRSLRKPTANYYYGFRQERFFWSLISACGIFFFGAGITLYHGVTSLFKHGPATTQSGIGYLILGLSLVIETASLMYAFKELKTYSNETGLLKIIRSGDPTTLAVLYEDGVAVLGSLLAALSIALTSLTGNPVWDAIGSILIGLLLGCVAALLVVKNREFLLDKAMPHALEERVLAILNAEPVVEKVIDFKSTTLDINTYRVKCEIEFNGTELLKDINKYGELHEEFDAIQTDYSKFVRFCTEMSDRAPRLIGTKINEIEKNIKENIPQVRHIDIEIN